MALICKGSDECLCIVSEHCLAMGVDSLGCGMVTDESKNEICKIGVPCCTLGLKKPEIVCAGVDQCLCMVGAHSFPYNDKYVGKPVCAVYCLSCAPEVGCCVEAPVSSVLKELTAQGESVALPNPVEKMER
eukprot:CAMPEP_0198288744 /NCGR_PEP_ID=MMETSP1449-20131203/7154_1 /TAXON_ID=420275 /ORGANISM="Attheya septentrionalis, Strain CCMP2084" /LENGTH=130 /DNA_ID=CAMNT_0043986951 /DNA_START=196 /DNA_END=588 /DNA_ORIENTATION=-